MEVSFDMIKFIKRCRFRAVGLCAIVLILKVTWSGIDPIATPRRTGPPIYYIGYKSDGRLGNLMFEFASMFGTSVLHNMTPVIEENNALLDVFMLNSIRRYKNSFSTLGAFISFQDISNRSCAYDPRIIDYPHPQHNLFMTGYLQSFKYFIHADKQLRREFTFVPRIVAIAKEFHAKLLKRAVPVGIHVRRGDILKEFFQEAGYTTPKQPYYTHAMDYVRSKFGAHVVFVVCSDNLAWAKSNIRGPDVMYCPDGLTPAEDMAILTLCKHTILSEGSFGWWAAWLANGTTIYYKHWPKPGTYLDYHVNKSDYFPVHWKEMA